MLQQPTSLNLGLTYNVPESLDMSPESYSNYSYWSGPDISNVTGDVVAVLDKAGSFGIVYGSPSDGAVYVYKNDGDYGGLFSVVNQSNWNRLSVLRRLILEANGNLRLYRWDNDVNGSRQWVAEWAAVSNSCDIAGICGNGICGFGSVYKGSLGDGTLIAVKKLDKVLPHGEREFITEETTEGTPEKVVDRQLGAIEKEELMRALMVAFWCIQDEVSMRPTMGEVVKILEGSVDINMPPMPKTVLELIEEGLDHVYKV
ncbi:hypothetical protein K7X08_035236 [Anisodus acutangulus]|uniref:S-locus glycoprotein domain-containing protein n=1 Tax=Anisodus acutangulus TaxID=402998 RepID=A0A9Q1R0E7_9SOLA|nr:hypothetical protein K7X08_035236 [Anisodus acutangulus]